MQAEACLSMPRCSSSCRGDCASSERQRIHPCTTRGERPLVAAGDASRLPCWTWTTGGVPSAELAHEACAGSQVCALVLRAVPTTNSWGRSQKDRPASMAHLMARYVGDVTIATLLAFGEPGQFPRRPMPSWLARRRWPRGRVNVMAHARSGADAPKCSLLYMATLAVRCGMNSVHPRKIHDRLIAKGKPPKVAIGCVRCAQLLIDPQLAQLGA